MATASDLLPDIGAATALSGMIRTSAESGDVRELARMMREREALLTGLFRALGGLSEHGFPAGEGGGWREIGAALAAFETENRLLIEALTERRRHIVRSIAEAERHRKLTAYAI
jgi:hypothetical protein